MSRLLLSALVATAGLFATVPSQSEPAAPQEATAQEHKMGKRLEALNLSEDQKAKLREIHGQQWPDKKSKHRAIMGVLTPEQRQQLKQMHAAKKH
jgi:Spy/CpxP family protein refolding chaperone